MDSIVSIQMTLLLEGIMVIPQTLLSLSMNMVSLESILGYSLSPILVSRSPLGIIMIANCVLGN